MSRKRTRDNKDADAEKRATAAATATDNDATAQQSDLKQSGVADKDAATSSRSEPPTNDSSSSSSDDDSSSDDEGSTVDVDFEFFEPSEIDFHGLKSLLTSAFGDDAQDFDISGLADLVLEQSEVGSTVKTDGEASDPYGIFTVLSLNRNNDVPVVRQIKDYLLKKAEKTRAGAYGRLADILNTPDNHVGLLISERVVNVPPQVIAPMLRMLVDEMEGADSVDETYSFDYFLLLCPLYKETESVADEGGSDSDSDNAPGAKRSKPPLVSVRRHEKSSTRGSNNNNGNGAAEPGSLLETYVYAEEEVIEEFAALKFDYKFTRSKRAAESRNSFAESGGLSPFRRCLAIPKSKLSALIDRLNEVLAH
ncbi:Mss4p nuclear export [Coemansia sp. RSA 1939]|nr:Mss4p nuclear export [Coemansia sp. RSA 1939]KAJ2612304.1 Mss4p nuclear export [Coemansia sp. RSA 1804]